jgi:hypothetical protein
VHREHLICDRFASKRPADIAFLLLILNAVQSSFSGCAYRKSCGWRIVISPSYYSPTENASGANVFEISDIQEEEMEG